MSDTGIVVDPSKGDAGQQAPQPTAQNTGDGFIVGAEPSAINERKTFEQQQAAQQGRTFSTEEVERIRSEERDKVMKRNEKIAAELAETRKQVEELAAQRKAEEDARAAAEAERQRLEEEALKEKMSAKEMIHKVESDMQQKFEEMARREQEAQLLLQKEREHFALVEYRNQRLADPEVAAQLAPQLHRFVGGNTQEEIDASITAAIESSQSIMGEVQQALQHQRQTAPGVTTYAPSQGPVDPGQATWQPSLKELQDMSPSEYAKWRPQLLAQARPPR